MRSRARRGFRRLGVDVVHYQPLAAWLREREISLVFDVGANEGRFAAGLRAEGYAGRIVSFEPAAAAFARLAAAADSDPGWEVVNRALGSATGSASLRVSAASEYSSLLEWDPAGPWPDRGAAPVATEEVEVRRLEDEFGEHVSSSERCFLKIDTQGYDLEVLEGAGSALERFAGAQVELPLTPLYRDQPPIDALLRFMRERGFVLWAIRPVLTDPASARMLDADAIFFRP